MKPSKGLASGLIALSMLDADVLSELELLEDRARPLPCLRPRPSTLSNRQRASRKARRKMQHTSRRRNRR